jgi:hypothetical protein
MPILTSPSTNIAGNQTTRFIDRSVPFADPARGEELALDAALTLAVLSQRLCVASERCAFGPGRTAFGGRTANSRRRKQSIPIGGHEHKESVRTGSKAFDQARRERQSRDVSLCDASGRCPSSIARPSACGRPAPVPLSASRMRAMRPRRGEQAFRQDRRREIRPE